jgi:tyrosyl-tRNA synthetase
MFRDRREQQMRELYRLKRVGAYCGVDPTADSLHLGHLLPFMAIFWMWFHGYQAVTLLGGSTARIGDPTDKNTSRPILGNAELTKNITKIHYQLKRLWANVEELGRKHEYTPHWAGTHRIVNNNMWLQGVTTYDMMKRLGRHIRIGPMLAKET